MVTSQLRVVHRTGYSYPGGAVASYNEARMTPQSSHEQVVLHTRVDITPTPWMYSYTDYWGTRVTAFEVHERHDELGVVSTSTVDVDRHVRSGQGLSWEELRSPETAGDFAETLKMSHLVDPGPDLAELVVGLAADASSPAELTRAVVDLVHDGVEYTPGATGVHTRAAEAWDGRRGVCQDIAHLTIGALRSVGVPARYVSGYVMPRKDSEVGEPVTGESHAWVQWWDGEWVSFDPTNNVPPADAHVDVAWGRDYSDVTPLRGIFTGVAMSSMFVEVEMTRLS